MSERLRERSALVDGLRRWGYPVAVGLVAVAALVIALLAPGRRGWFDVGVYWGAAHWWRGGGGVYDYLTPGTRYGFTYPPFALLCLLPLALVGRSTAVVGALVVNLGCLALLLHWLVRPLIRERGWHPWYPLVVAASLAAVFGPIRDTISFGQVNLVLLVLVLADLRTLNGPTRNGPTRNSATRNSATRNGPTDGTAAGDSSRRWPVPAHWAGIGIGLAGAVKLTPLLFIGYALVVREWRLARVATGVFLAATLGAWVIAPHDSAVFWTHALRRTDRVGDLGYVSNQSLLGALYRLGTGDGEHLRWLLAVLAVLAWWAVRVRRPDTDDTAEHTAGFALTGVAACLVSPVSWVHHLVWLLPALLLALRAGLGPAAAGQPADRSSVGRRWPLLGIVAGGYLALSIGLVWIAAPATGLARLLGANAGVWVSLLLLACVPVPGPVGRVDARDRAGGPRRR